MNFLIKNWDSILFIVLLIFTLYFLAKKGAKKKVYEILFYLVTIAEKEFGGGTGQLKYSAVSTWVYEKLPAVTRILFTNKQLDMMIEESVDRMKEYLESNINAQELVEGYKFNSAL